MQMKQFMTALLLFAALTVQGQMMQSGIIRGNSHQNSADLSQPAPWQEALPNPTTAATMRRAAADAGVRWIDRIHNLPTHLKDFYTTYGSMVHDVLAGKKNALSDPSLGIYNADGNEYDLVVKTYTGTIDFTYPKDASLAIIGDNAYAAVEPVCSEQWNNTDCFMLYLCLCLTYDYPEGFWLDSNFQWGDYWQYSYSYNPAGTKGTLEYTHVITFRLKGPQFNHLRKDFQNPQTLATAVTEYNQKVNQLVANCPKNGWRYNQIVYLNDWLTKNNSYNSDYGTTQDIAKIAWSPLSALRGSTGKTGPVCEGYARAFKVLCDKLGIPCVLATGYARSQAGGNGVTHMWNEVQMENGLWYAIDVTWNDPIDSQNRKESGYENRKWLLLGSQDVVGQDLTYAQSHPVSITWGLNAQNVKKWDYSMASLITASHYDFAAGIGTPACVRTASDPTLYTLGGQRLGKDAPAVTGRKARMVVGNGRKYILK